MVPPRVVEALRRQHPLDPAPPPPQRAALRRRWANLIRRVYVVRHVLGGPQSQRAGPLSP